MKVPCNWFSLWICTPFLAKQGHGAILGCLPAEGGLAGQAGWVWGLASLLFNRVALCAFTLPSSYTRSAAQPAKAAEAEAYRSFPAMLLCRAFLIIPLPAVFAPSWATHWSLLLLQARPDTLQDTRHTWHTAHEQTHRDGCSGSLSPERRSCKAGCCGYAL